MFTKFVNVVRNTIDRHPPLFRLSKNKAQLYRKPWIMKGILVSIRKKQITHKTLFRNGNAPEKLIYKDYSNFLTRVKKLSKQICHQYLREENRSSPQKRWTTIREIKTSRKKKKNSSITRIKTNDGFVTDAGDMAEEKNNFFVNIGK